MREQAMLLSKYIEIVKPTYATLQIIPHSSIRNYNSSNIAKMVSTMYQSIKKSIKRIERKYFVESRVKCSYMIDIYKDNVNFYFVVPEQYHLIAKEKISSVWPQATIERVPEIPEFAHENTTTYQMKYAKMDAFSLDVNRKSNYPLNNILNVIDIMETEDRVAVFYNFQPCSQYGWATSCDKAHDRFKENMPISKDMDSKYIFWTALYKVVDFIDKVINELLGEKKLDINPITELSNLLRSNTKTVAEATRQKRHDTVLNTQIAVISQSSNTVRATNNAISVCQSFQELRGDNELVYEKTFNKGVNFMDYKLKGIETNKVSTAECQNFIQLPAKELLEKHHINHVNTLETEIPEELLDGYIWTGKHTYKGKYKHTYMSADNEIANLPLILLGSMGAGKTTYFKGYAKQVAKQWEGLIVLDYIKRCELSNEIAKSVPKDKLLVIDLSNPEHLQSFAYNEYKVTGTTPFDVIESANLHQQQLLALVDAIAFENPLSSQMRKYFTSACDVVLVNDGMCLRDVIDCLENYDKRHQFIDKLPGTYKEYLIDQINTLLELDDVKDVKVKEVDEAGKETTRTEVRGATKYSKIEHIMDRINLIREDLRMRLMFNKSPKDNIDFVEAMDEGKVILIKMPEVKFKSKHVKNVLVTFFISKLWLACKIRGDMHDKPLRTHLILDEIFQAPTSYRALGEMLRETRKFQLKLIFSAHQLYDLKELQGGLKSGGASYMLLQGTDKRNFSALEAEFSQGGYMVDDLLNLKRYHSLNLIKYSKGYASFISDLTV